MLYYAELMGLKKISMYDGGWTEWSKSSKNQIETGLPKTLSPYANNDNQQLKPISSASCFGNGVLGTIGLFFTLASLGFF